MTFPYHSPKGALAYKFDSVINGSDRDRGSSEMASSPERRALREMPAKGGLDGGTRRRGAQFLCEDDQPIETRRIAISYVPQKGYYRLGNQKDTIVEGATVPNSHYGKYLLEKRLPTITPLVA